MPTSTCQTCARPMRDKADFPRGNFSSAYCSDCVDARGILKSRDEIRAQMIQLRVSRQGMTEDEAVEQVDNLLRRLPAWNRPQTVTF